MPGQAALLDPLNGGWAGRLCTGLQIREDRFDSDTRLQIPYPYRYSSALCGLPPHVYRGVLNLWTKADQMVGWGGGVSRGGGDPAVLPGLRRGCGASLKETKV